MNIMISSLGVCDEARGGTITRCNEGKKKKLCISYM